jgi:hypothetical protein
LCKNCGRQFIEPLSQLPQIKIDAVSATSNGHTVTSMAEVTLLSPEKEQPTPEIAASSATIQAEELLKALLSPQLQESELFRQFIQKLQELTEPPRKPAGGNIAILLLDAENLKLDSHIERFLGTLCTYPIQVKVAFANWRNPTIGKQDAELYDRGYQLVHVPSGHSSADAKMIAVGSSLFLQYPMVKEIFICSSDGLLTHLCNQLQSQGVTVYLVRRIDTVLTVENRTTGTQKHYSLSLQSEIPSLTNLMTLLESSIKAEQQAIHERLGQLSTLDTFLQERCNILNENRAESLSVTIQEQDITEPTTEQNPTQLIESTSITEANVGEPSKSSEQALVNIHSIAELEQVLVKLLNTSTAQSSGSYIPINTLGTEFQRHYRQSVTTVIKKLQLKCNFIKFLQSCSAFKLQQAKEGWQVAIAQPEPATLK